MYSLTLIVLLDTYCVDTTVPSYLPYQRVSLTTSSSPLCGLYYNDKGGETKFFNSLMLLCSLMLNVVVLENVLHSNTIMSRGQQSKTFKRRLANSATVRILA